MTYINRNDVLELKQLWLLSKSWLVCEKVVLQCTPDILSVRNNNFYKHNKAPSGGQWPWKMPIACDRTFAFQSTAVCILWIEFLPKDMEAWKVKWGVASTKSVTGNMLISNLHRAYFATGNPYFPQFKTERCLIFYQEQRKNELQFQLCSLMFHFQVKCVVLC